MFDLQEDTNGVEMMTIIVLRCGSIEKQRNPVTTNRKLSRLISAGDPELGTRKKKIKLWMQKQAVDEGDEGNATNELGSEAHGKIRLSNSRGG